MNQPNGSVPNSHVARAQGVYPELFPEDEERDQPQPEDRSGHAEEREAHGAAVGRRAALERRDDADGHAHEEPDDRRADRERERPWQPFDDLCANGAAAVVRDAETGPAAAVDPDRAAVAVAGDEPPQIEPVLRVPGSRLPHLRERDPEDGFVEPELLLDLGDDLRRRLLAGEPDSLVARHHHEEDEEREEGHDEDDQPCPEKPSDHVAPHRDPPVRVLDTEGRPSGRPSVVSLLRCYFVCLDSSIARCAQAGSPEFWSNV